MYITPLLFTYGTLMVPDVQSALLGRVPACSAAVLNGYRRCSIEGECYPAIVRDELSTVHGLALEGLTPTELEILDAYEGDPYVRTSVELAIDGARVAADCYVWSNARDTRLGLEDWKLDAFVVNHLSAYLRALNASSV